MDLPLPEFSLIFFVMTFGVGYVTLLWAYSGANRLYDWNGLDMFDKTLQTFTVGAVITLASMIALDVPFYFFTSDFGSTDQWLGMFGRDVLLLIPLELTLIFLVKKLIEDRLTQNPKGYIS